MTTIVDLIGLLASIKELAPLFTHLQGTDFTHLYTQLVKRHVEQQCQTLNGSVVFDEKIFASRLAQHKIDLHRQPVTADGLSEAIGDDVLNILLDNTVVYGVDLDKHRAKAAIRDAHAQYPNEIFKHNPLQSVWLGQRDIERLLKDHPQLKDMEQYLRSLGESIQKSLATIQITQERINAATEHYSQQFGQILQSIDGQFFFASGKPPIDTPPQPPVVYAQRQGLIEDYCTRLRSIPWLALIGGSGKGKTQIARTIARICDFENVRWISLRGRAGIQAEQHLSDQIVLWSDSLSPDEGIWQLHKLGRVSVNSALKHIANATNGKGLLIVDDLPEPAEHENRELFVALATMAEALTSYGIRLVTTSKRELPADLWTLVVVRPTEIAPPIFSNKDVEEMLDRAGAPQELRERNVIAIILAVTKGLPILVAAAVRWWQQTQWKLRTDEFDALLSGDPIRDMQTNYQRQFARFVNDRGRELVYRLSLLYIDVDESTIRKIATVTPAIQYPQECLDELVGIWIDRVERTYAVTPLLKDSGKQNLPLERQKQVHETVANCLLDNKVISSENIFPIAMHLWCAELYERLIGFLTQVIQSVETPSQAIYLEWVPFLFSPEKEWDPKIRLSQKIMLRGVQIRTQVLAGKDSSKLEADLDALIAQAQAGDAPAILFAYASIGTMINKCSDVVPVSVALKLAIKLVQALRTTSIIPSDLLRFIPQPLDDIIWFQVVRLDNPKEVRPFLDKLRHMTNIERDALFQSDLAINVISLVLDRLCVAESEKPQQERDWQAILALLDEASEVGQLPGATVLHVAEVRARAIIYADHLKRVDEALTLLESLPSQTHPDLQFLLHFTAACILFDSARFAECIPHFEHASSAISDSMSHFGFFLKQFMTVAYGQVNRWQDAQMTCIHAIQIGNGRSDLRYHRLEMCGELAWIHWVSGNKKKSCAALCGLVLGLMDDDDSTNPRFREVYNKAGHALSWFIANATKKQSSFVTKDGELSKPVEAGFFGVPRRSLQDHVSSFKFAMLPLLSSVETLADLLDLHKVAWNAYKVSSRIEDTAATTLSPLLSVGRTSLAARFGHPDEALALGLLAVRTSIRYARLFEGATHPMKALTEPVNLDEMWSQLSSDQRVKAERQMLFLLFVPAFSELLGSSLTEENAVAHLDTWKESVIARQRELEDVAFWLNIVNIFKEMITVSINRSPQAAKPQLLNNPEYKNLEVLWFLAASNQRGISLKESMTRQVRPLEYLLTYRSHVPIRHIMPGIGNFIHRFWVEVATTQGFNLSHPALIKQELSSMPHNHNVKSVIYMVTNVCRAVGVLHFPPDLQAVFDQALAEEE